jgi:hypothetical protein
MRELLPFYIKYDECRHPRRGAPVADRRLKLQKKSLPAVPRRGLEAGDLRIYYDFQSSGVKSIGTYSFLPSG